MRPSVLLAVVCAVLSLVAVAHAGPDNLNHLLRGDYAISGEATCLVVFDSASGPTSRLLSFAVEAVRTFNGDGTGTLSGRSVTFGGTTFFSGDFTYAVAPDGTTFTSEVTSPMTFTDPNGNSAGTLEAADATNPLVPVVGHISRDRDSLVFATARRVVEVRTFANGSFERRICHRARSAVKIR